jgi:hypothetical protein
VVNKEFAQKDQAFINACEKAGIKPTKRQASKYRNKKGIAFKTGK